MMARVALGAALCAVVALAGPVRAPAQTAPAPAEPESVEALPAGAGRDETFGYCTPCHSTAVIRRSGFSRDRWDELMDWMAERHGMNPLEGELRETIVGYLARQFGPRRAGAPRAANPFLAD